MTFALKGPSLFVWRYFSAKQKILSLRSLRLCGENPVLDTRDMSYKSLVMRRRGAYETQALY
jgi:hypothetical protein